jgi:hypothetical protein
VSSSSKNNLYGMSTRHVFNFKYNEQDRCSIETFALKSHSHSHSHPYLVTYQIFCNINTLYLSTTHSRSIPSLTPHFHLGYLAVRKAVYDDIIRFPVFSCVRTQPRHPCSRQFSYRSTTYRSQLQTPETLPDASIKSVS